MQNYTWTATASSNKGSTNNSVDKVIEKDWKKALIFVEVTALNGAPSAATLDISVEHKTPVEGLYVRSKTKGICTVSDADLTQVYTEGDHTFGDFSQVTHVVTLTWLEVRGLDDFLSNTMRIKWTIAFTGGTAPSWTFSVTVQFLE
jgi:hypothetical protein